MHNCKDTKEQLTELVLDGVDGGVEKTLAAELNQCRACRTEFEELSATLRITARLRETAAPAESYWTGYHALLRQKLLNAEEQAPAKAQRRKDELGPLFVFSSAPLRPFVRALLRPIPVPLGAAALVVCAMLGLFALSARREPVPQNPIVVQVPVQVPVIQEKSVTRIVYRDRRSHSSRSAKRSLAGPNTEGTFARTQKPRNDELPVTLTGFKPNDEVKLTVIKGGSANEK